MKSILLDIEGTTTPIDFVIDTLFPYSRERVAWFVEKHFNELRDDIKLLTDERANDPKYTAPVHPTEPGSVSAYLEFLIDENRKSTALKSIQGKIWREGYDGGEITSVVFDDVPVALKRWTDNEIDVSIYSSGSVLAQQLLFRHTNHGDLTRWISNYFDTETGGKKESESYLRIAERLKSGPEEIVFCSDVPEELDAARKAGMVPVLVLRPGNAPVHDPGGYRILESFDDLDAS